MSPIDDGQVCIYFRAPRISVVWDDVVRCVVLERSATAAELDADMARRKVLDLLRTKRAKRCIIRTQTLPQTNWLAEARSAGMRALAIVLPKTSDVTIDFRASIARVTAGDVAVRCFDRVDHARLWLVTAASARHSSKPMARVSVPRISIPPRISIRPSKPPRRSILGARPHKTPQK